MLTSEVLPSNQLLNGKASVQTPDQKDVVSMSSYGRNIRNILASREFWEAGAKIIGLVGLVVGAATLLRSTGNQDILSVGNNRSLFQDEVNKIIEQISFLPTDRKTCEFVQNLGLFKVSCNNTIELTVPLQSLRSDENACPLLEDARLFIPIIGTRYEGSIVEGCPYHGEMKFSDGNTRKGFFEKALLTGEGEIGDPQGSYYVGQLEKGMAHGQGVRVFTDGSRYVGGFSFGKFTGQGLVIYPNETTAKGTKLKNRAVNLLTQTAAIQSDYESLLSKIPRV